MPHARDPADELTATGVVLSVDGSQDDPQDPVVRLRGQKPQLAPARQRHLLTLPGRSGCPAPVAGWAPGGSHGLSFRPTPTGRPGSAPSRSSVGMSAATRRRVGDLDAVLWADHKT